MSMARSSFLGISEKSPLNLIEVDDQFFGCKRVRNDLEDVDIAPLDSQ